MRKIFILLLILYLFNSGVKLNKSEKIYKNYKAPVNIVLNI